MGFMRPEIIRKGALYACDCAKCGTTSYTHEWLADNFSEDRDAMEAGTFRCEECGGKNDPDTVYDCGKNYAGRYSAPGYMDCTTWDYAPNLRNLKRELRNMYEGGVEGED